MFSLLIILNACEPTAKDEPAREMKIESKKEMVTVKKKQIANNSKVKVKVSLDSIQQVVQKEGHSEVNSFAMQKAAYLAFVDSLGLKNERTYQRYKNKVDLIESKFKDYLVLETNHKHLDVSSTLWSTDSFRESVYAKILTGTLDSIFIEKNYQILIRSLFAKGELRRAFQLDSWTQANYKELRDSLFNNYRYKSSIEGLIKHRVIVDSLDELTGMRPDSLFFQKALALELVCTSSWFCHEGCGGCDLRLLVNGLNSFIRKYPKSSLIDEAEYKLIDLDTYYDTGEDETYYGLEQAYLNFLGKYPKSSKAKEVIKRLLSIYSDRISFAKNHTDYLLQRIDEEYEYLNEDKDIQKYRERITNSNR